jgi:hypothetical protein
MSENEVKQAQSDVHQSQAKLERALDHMSGSVENANARVTDALDTVRRPIERTQRAVEQGREAVGRTLQRGREYVQEARTQIRPYLERTRMRPLIDRAARSRGTWLPIVGAAGGLLLLAGLIRRYRNRRDVEVEAGLPYASADGESVAPVIVRRRVFFRILPDRAA